MTGPPRTAPATVRVPVVATCTLRIDVAPDLLWDEIKRMYVAGEKFVAQGYAVTPLADPAAVFGGTVVRRQLPSGAVEERIARFTRIDDGRRLLALHVRYSEGMAGNVSYEVRGAGAGSEFELIAHMEQDLPLDGPDTLAARVEALQDGHCRALLDTWLQEKARLEAR